MLDMHSNVRITEILEAGIFSNVPLIRVGYKVKRGRKTYKIWLLPDDFIGTGLFPLSYKWDNSTGKTSTVYTMDNQIVYSGKTSTALQIVDLSNKRYFEHSK